LKKTKELWPKEYFEKKLYSFINKNVCDNIIDILLNIKEKIRIM